MQLIQTATGANKMKRKKSCSSYVRARNGLFSVVCNNNKWWWQKPDKFYSALNRIEVFKMKFAIVASLSWSEKWECFFFDFSHTFTLREIKSPYSGTGQKQREKKLSEAIYRHPKIKSRFSRRDMNKYGTFVKLPVPHWHVCCIFRSFQGEEEKCIQCKASASRNGRITSILRNGG